MSSAPDAYDSPEEEAEDFLERGLIWRAYNKLIAERNALDAGEAALDACARDARRIIIQ